MSLQQSCLCSLVRRSMPKVLPSRGAALAGLLLGAAWMADTALAESVTVELVTPAADGKLAPIQDRHALRKSPYDGWVMVTWPFSMFLDNQRIMEHRSAESKVMDDNLSGAGAGSDKLVKDLLVATVDGDTAGGVTTMIPRRSSQSLDLAAGTHTIKPFGIEFSLDADGGLTSKDPRIRIDGKTRRLQIICHPVVIRPLSSERSAAAAMQVTSGAGPILGGIENYFADLDKREMAPEGTAARRGFRRLELYLPASAPGNAYDVNGTKFDVGADGKVTLSADVKTARCADGRMIALLLPSPRPPAAAVEQSVGITWFGAKGEIKIVGASTPLDDGSGTGSTVIRTRLSDNRRVSLGNVGANLPPIDPLRPIQHVLWDVANASCWVVEAPPLEAKPGAQWSCRIRPTGGKAQPPAVLQVTVEPVGGGAAAGDVALQGAGDLFTGTLPAKAGFWRLRLGDGSPMKGQTLGVVLIGDTASAGVSLFTVNNRAMFRRSDTFDLLWVARRGAGAAAAEWPVRLRGVGLDTVVGRIAVPAGDSGAADVSGRLVVDTTALGAGEYTAAVEADGVAGYPFRFRICQRERLSDFDIYSWTSHVSGGTPFPGSPVNSYVGGTRLGGGGMELFLADGDGAAEGVFGSYAGLSLGPVPEMFARPGMEERNGMALAAVGLHNAPGWPEAHSYESSNPKHTLPENLAWVRRRMALFAQTHADYPGIDGFDYGWNWSIKGYWGDSGPRLDGWQPEAAKQSEAVAWKVTQEIWPKVVAHYAYLKPIKKTLSDKWPKELADIPGLTEAQMGYVGVLEPNGWELRLPNAFKEWYADLDEIMPRMTGHAHVSSPGLGNGVQYREWLGKSHRSSVDFSERMMSPFDCWRSPAILAMDNQDKQKIQLAIQSHGLRAQDLPSLFAAAGRGADGFAFSGFSEKSDQETIERARVFERFGSWFVSYDPLPDVALYPSRNGNGIRTALYDLARMRRPGIMVGPHDVLAGELLKYKVLLLVSMGDELPPDILDAFRAFEAKGGVILKDDTCHKDVPGRSIGFGYEKENVSGAWGGAQAGGEYEHTAVLKSFLGKQDKLIKAFADTPKPPVTTPDTDVLISPLAGKDAIICFVINKTEVPLDVMFPSELSSRFRQKTVLPKISELQVEKDWYVQNLLTGQAAPSERAGKVQRVPLELTRAEGEIYLLMRRKPVSMMVQAAHVTPACVRLTGGLADAQGKLLADPMPFEVTLKGPDGATLFHKFASIGPNYPLDLPVPAMSAEAKPTVVLRDLVLGTSATQTLEPAAPAAMAVRQTPDLIGGEKKILAFFSERKHKGPVTILLDEGQEAYRPAAEKMAALLKQAGREARVTTFDPVEVQSYCLRWYPRPEDLAVVRGVTNDFAWAWRVDMNTGAAFKRDAQGKIINADYANPACGYAEGGPRLRHDADVVLFGTPEDHRVVADVAPWLRRRPSANYPAPGGFFVHYLWSPFRATYDALYVGCRDAAGAEAAVACIASLKVPDVPPEAKPADKPVTISGGKPAPVENMEAGLGGTTVLSLDYSPSGNRLFAATFACGEWLFAMDAEGNIIEHLLPPETEVWPDWYQWGRYVSPLSDTLLRIYLWNGVYRYELGRGWISMATREPVLEDKDANRFYRGGADRLLALDPDGRVLWTYEDCSQSPDLTVIREVSAKAFSGDRRVLLVSAFGKGERGALVAPAVLGLDPATGKVLWTRNGIQLASGTVIPMEDRFIVLSDDGLVHDLMAQSGQTGGAMAAFTSRPDFILEVAGRKLMIAANNQYSRFGLESRVYLRPLAGGAEQPLNVPGRVQAVAVAPDKQSFVVATSTRRLMRFGADGNLLWDSELPMTGRLLFSPDGKTVASGGRDGMVRLYDAADGKLRREVDLNRFNVITADAYARQKRMGDVPVEAARTPKAPPPEPSYVKTLPKKAVTFGPNLAPPEKMQALLKPAEGVAVPGEKPGYLGQLTESIQLPPIAAQAGTTYLVELLDALGTGADGAPPVRLEIAVTGKLKAKNLPCTVRLPVEANMARRRFAFRADNDDHVTLTMRAVMPAAIGNPADGASSPDASGKDKNTPRSFDKVETSTIPAVIGDVVVSAMRFPGRNVLFDGGPGSKTKPYGTFDCTLYAERDTDSSTIERDVKIPSLGLQLVNGIIANNNMVWDKISRRKEGELAYADAVAGFEKKGELSAVVVYEDTSGPVILKGEQNVRERTAMRYAVEVRKAGGGWVRVGAVADNTQLVNIFPCPGYPVDGVRYVWAGRHDDVERRRTDGFVRTGQLEAYLVGGVIDIKEVLEAPPANSIDALDFK